MQVKHLLLSTIAGITGFYGAVAFADMSIPYGWYLEANIGQSKIIGSGYRGASSTSGLGGNVNLGYKFMPYFGMEVGYTQYTSITIKDQFGIQAGTIKNYSYDLTTKGIIPYPQAGLELFAKLGVSRANANVTTTNSVAAANIGLPKSQGTTGVYFGVGAQYYFTPVFAFILQWQRAQGNSTTGAMDLYSIGLSFIFDSGDSCYY